MPQLDGPSFVQAHGKPAPLGMETGDGGGMEEEGGRWEAGEGTGGEEGRGNCC